MKSLVAKLFETKEPLSFTNTVNLIDSIKTWYQYISMQLEDSEYLEKNVKKNVSTFINDTIINADYMDEIIGQLIEHYKLNIESKDDWTKIQEAFIDYIFANT